MGSNERRLFVPLVVSCLLFFEQPFPCTTVPCNAAETDTLKAGQQLKDYDFLVSAGGVFRLGFFSPGTSQFRYLGIWYNHDPDQSRLWVANRKTPIEDSTGSLTIDDRDGKLKISYTGGNPIVLNNPLQSVAGNVTATLLDSGNFVLREADSNGTATGRVLWQSFDYPTNTLLPGMKLGVNLKNGHNWSLTSWSSNNVPARGAFAFGLDPITKRQLVIWRRGHVYWTSGIWQNDTVGFSLYPGSIWVSDYNFSYVSKEDEIYFTFSAKNRPLPQLFLSVWGVIFEDTKLTEWPLGSSCDETDPGCVEEEEEEKNKAACRRGSDGFELQVGFMTGGDPLLYDGNPTLTISDCHYRCWANCSCVAYATANGNFTGCRLWDRKPSFRASAIGENIRLFRAGKKRRSWWIWFIIAASCIIVLIFSLCYHLRRKFRLKGERQTGQEQVFLDLGVNATTLNELSNRNELSNDDMEDHDLKVFKFSSIMVATNSFSDENKLGKGGFGPVYKGKLNDGCEVAVKRLSSNSRQGLVEFKNEIKLIAEIQHMNLVRLLGCCIDGKEKMIIYEYMPNKSLDFFLFDPIKRQQLDWKTRLNIIEGIAQGLLYLHRYSRLKIIHRDLKAANILLDNDMNPKISDFGLARIFAHNETEANTNRLVGTRGYMSPEYAMQGIVSVKSDVFSFGILLLEILSGRRCTSICCCLEESLNLVGYAWMLWNDGKALELRDPSLATSCPEQELLKYIHVGLLCVQEKPMDRPDMSAIISMISDENMQFPPPKRPAFSGGRSMEEVDPSSQTST